MKEGFKALFGQECGLGIKYSTGVFDLKWAFDHIIKWKDGEYTDDDAERAEMWKSTHFSRYNQLLEHFADARGVELEHSELRDIPQDVIGKIRYMIHRYKTGREGSSAQQGDAKIKAVDPNDDPRYISTVTTVAMEQFKLMRDRLLNPKQHEPSFPD